MNDHTAALAECLAWLLGGFRAEPLTHRGELVPLKTFGITNPVLESMKAKLKSYYDSSQPPDPMPACCSAGLPDLDDSYRIGYQWLCDNCETSWEHGLHPGEPGFVHSWDFVDGGATLLRLA